MSTTISIVPSSEDIIENASELNMNPKPKSRNIFTRIAHKIQHTASNLASKTRSKASNTAHAATEKANELANKAKSKMSNTAHAATDKASDLVNKAKSQVSDTAHAAADKASGVADKAKSQVSQVAHSTAGKAGNLANKASSTVSNAAGQVYGNVKDDLHYRRNRAHYAEAIKKWAAGAPQPSSAERGEAFKADLAQAETWIQQLPEKELQHFTDGMSQYLESLGFNIDWLVSERFPLTPNLQHSIGDAALLYSISAWHAQQARPALNAQLAYESWAAAPEKHQAFGQQLFEKLTAKKLVSIPADIIFADDKARAKSLVEMAKNAYALHPSDFNVILNEIS